MCPRSNHFFGSRVLMAWKLEIGLLLLSVSTLMAILLTLWSQDGKVSQFPSGITLNSLVSVLTVILRLALVFVLFEIIGQTKWEWLTQPRRLLHLHSYLELERGRWISLASLVRSEIPVIAVAGCIIAILSVAIGPFVQQSIRTVVCEQPDPSASAAIAATTSMPGSYTAANVSHPFDLKVESAIVNTMIDPSLADSGIPFICSTGNCSFPTLGGASYASLGACSKCFNIASLVQEFRIPTYTSAGVFYEGHSYSLPNGMAVALFNATVDSHTNEQSYQSFEAGAGHLDWTLPILRNDPKALSEWEAIFSVAIANVSLLALKNCKGRPCPHQGLNLTSLPRNWNLEAFSCVLYGCLKSIRGKVQMGRATETVVSTAVLTQLGSTIQVSSIPEFTSSPTITPIPVGGGSSSAALGQRALPEDGRAEDERNQAVWAAIKDPCTIDGVSYSRDNFSAVPKNTTIIPVSFQKSDLNSTTETTIRVPSPCFYRMAKTQFSDARNVVKTLFDSCPGSNSTGSHALLLCDSRWWLKIFRDDRRNVSSKMGTFDGIAAAVTNQLRELGRSGDAVEPGLVYGTAYRTVACTQINRWWLAFPVILVVLSVLLLGVVIVQTGVSEERRKMPNWKSSTLPLLFNWSQQTTRYEDVTDLKTMKTRADAWSMYLGGEHGKCELRVGHAGAVGETRTEWGRKGS